MIALKVDKSPTSSIVSSGFNLSMAMLSLRVCSWALFSISANNLKPESTTRYHILAARTHMRSVSWTSHAFFSECCQRDCRFVSHFVSWAPRLTVKATFTSNPPPPTFPWKSFSDWHCVNEAEMLPLTHLSMNCSTKSSNWAEAAHSSFSISVRSDLTVVADEQSTNGTRDASVDISWNVVCKQNGTFGVFSSTCDSEFFLAFLLCSFDSNH